MMGIYGRRLLNSAVHLGKPVNTQARKTSKRSKVVDKCLQNALRKFCHSASNYMSIGMLQPPIWLTWRKLHAGPREQRSELGLALEPSCSPDHCTTLLLLPALLFFFFLIALMFSHRALKRLKWFSGSDEELLTSADRTDV